MTRYRDAGVDIARADALKEAIGASVRTTWGSGVRRLAAGFAGIVEWPAGESSERGGRAGEATNPARSGPPLLAATMDGVGTKLHLALAAGRVGDAAADLVFHTANDLLVHGARPLAFLDYVAQERLDPGVVTDVLHGLARGCREVGAALLGGETAEMPDTYREGVVDVAGCLIGWVDERAVLDGRAIRPGDVLLGLASSGLHTNGYSLARRVLADSGGPLGAPLPGEEGVSVGEALLRPHRWYGPLLVPALERGGIHALAHVTGGGIAGNLVRVLPPGVRARVRAGAWVWPPVFRWIVEAGRVPEHEARRVFNLGIGMVAVCEGSRALALAHELEAGGETVHEIGDVVAGERGVEWLET